MNKIAVCGLSAVMAAVLWAGNSYAGPFGMSMGMKESDFKEPLKPVENQKWTYSTARAPKPDNSFAGYKLLISPKSGLCRVEAIGRTIETNAQGTELISAYYGLKEQLSGKYQKPDWDQDSLSMGSTMMKPEDSMAALLKGERILVAAWVLEGDHTDGIAGIVLTANAQDRSHGFLKLKYEFRCYAQLKAELGSEALTVKEILDQSRLAK